MRSATGRRLPVESTALTSSLSTPTQSSRPSSKRRALAEPERRPRHHRRAGRGRHGPHHPGRPRNDHHHGTCRSPRVRHRARRGLHRRSDQAGDRDAGQPPGPADSTATHRPTRSPSTRPSSTRPPPTSSSVRSWTARRSGKARPACPHRRRRRDRPVDVPLVQTTAGSRRSRRSDRAPEAPPSPRPRRRPDPTRADRPSATPPRPLHPRRPRPTRRPRNRPRHRRRPDGLADPRHRARRDPSPSPSPSARAERRAVAIAPPTGVLTGTLDYPESYQLTPRGRGGRPRRRQGQGDVQPDRRDADHRPGRSGADRLRVTYDPSASIPMRSTPCRPASSTAPGLGHVEGRAGHHERRPVERGGHADLPAGRGQGRGHRQRHRCRDHARPERPR